MKLSDLEALNEQFPYDCSRRETIRLDQQSRIIKESAGPQTGIYWWVPRSAQQNTTWRLVSFFDDEYGTCYHKEIWEKYAATILGVDDIEVPQEVRDAYHCLPRGRVNVVKSKINVGLARYIILHGNDAPIEDVVGAVISRFRLSMTNTTISFDSHEVMLDDDIEIVKNFLAR